MRADKKTRRFSAVNILPLLKTKFIGKETIFLPEIDSTNNFALKLLKGKMVSNGALIIANYQSAGRGRHGKRWLAPKGKALLFSVIFTELQQSPLLPLLTLAGSLSVAEAIRQGSPSLKPVIRWPNDILINGKKVAGVLAETSAELKASKPTTGAVLGIGINVNQRQKDFLPEIATTATSLSILLGKPISRLEILTSVLLKLEKNYSALEQGQHNKFWSRFKKLSSTLGKGIRIKLPDGRKISGTAVDIDTDGALLVRLDSGQTIKFFSGDIEELQWAE